MPQTPNQLQTCCTPKISLADCTLLLNIQTFSRSLIGFVSSSSYCGFRSFPPLPLPQPPP
jgi:hypothetical protein